MPGYHRKGKGRRREPIDHPPTRKGARRVKDEIEGGGRGKAPKPPTSRKRKAPTVRGRRRRR